MSKEVDPIFYECVNEKLAEFANELIDEMHQAHSTAIGCGCPQCWKRYWRLVDEVEYEAWRLSRDHDHELEWEINYFINKHLKGYLDE